MIKKRVLFQILLLIVSYYHLVFTMARRGDMTVEGKAEAAMPVTTNSPPEGNTTFLGGTTWCVAKPSASQADLQKALDWACGDGKTDCKAILKGGVCFEPDTVLSHASYAFNSYYQQNGNSDIACNFGGTAIVTNRDPSYGKCHYATSGSLSSSSPPMDGASFLNWWSLLGLLLLMLYMRSW